MFHISNNLNNNLVTQLRYECNEHIKEINKLKNEQVLTKDDKEKYEKDLKTKDNLIEKYKQDLLSLRDDNTKLTNDLNKCQKELNNYKILMEKNSEEEKGSVGKGKKNK